MNSANGNHNNNNDQSMANTSAMLNSLNDSSNVHSVNIHDKNKNLLQEMAAKKREDMRMMAIYGVKRSNNSNANTWGESVLNEQDKMKENSFWALQENDSDEENEDDSCRRAATTSAGGLFSFAAPSFIVPSSAEHSQGGNSGLNQAVAVDDPDL